MTDFKFGQLVESISIAITIPHSRSYAETQWSNYLKMANAD